MLKSRLLGAEWRVVRLGADEWRGERAQPVATAAPLLKHLAPERGCGGLQVKEAAVREQKTLGALAEVRIGLAYPVEHKVTVRVLARLDQAAHDPDTECSGETFDIEAASATLSIILNKY